MGTASDRCCGDRTFHSCLHRALIFFLVVHSPLPIVVNDMSPTSRNILMTKCADDITCSIPVGSNVNDYVSREAENIKVWAVRNLMKLNLSKTK